MMTIQSKILNKSIWSNLEVKILHSKISSVSTWMKIKMAIFSLQSMF